MPAAKQSPIAGSFEAHQEAKLWWLLAPGGHRYQVRNLHEFCRDHASLFTPDPWINAYAGTSMAYGKEAAQNKSVEELDV